MIRLYKLRDYDFRLVIALVVLSTIGVLLVGSADASLQNRQLMGLILGLAAMVVVSLMDFSWVLNFSWVIYFLNILLLLAVRLFGNDANGATRWISIGGFTFQPTELAKIVIILFFARFFMEHEEDLNTLRTIVKSIILLAVPLALIYIQPDLKNTLTIVILFCMIIYMAGLSYKIIGGGLLVVIPLVIVFLFIIMQPNQSLIPDYQRNRIMSFLNSEEDEYSDSVLQQENSVMAIGSGQLTGKGLNNNEVSSANNGNFVSENQTDFIFSVAGEELGFIGCAAIILLLLFIIFECIRISLRAKDLSGKLICCGMGALIGIQSFINIGVVTNILPNTGTPLPFVSYGLTSMVSLYIGMGLVLNVGLQRYKKYREVDES